MKRQTRIAVLLAGGLLYVAAVIAVGRWLQARTPARVSESPEQSQQASESAGLPAIGGEPARLVLRDVRPATTAQRGEAAVENPLPSVGAPADSLPVALSSPEAAPEEPGPQTRLLPPEPAPPGELGPPDGIAAQGWQREIQVAHRPLDWVASHEPGSPAEPKACGSNPVPVPGSALDMVPVNLYTPRLPQLEEESALARPVVANPVLVRPTPAKPAARRARPALPLTGTHPCTMDEQHGLTLPATVRQQLGSPAPRALFLTAGPDGCLWLCSPGGLERLAEQFDRSPADGPAAHVFRRLYFAHTEASPLDQAGRLVVPEHLARFAGLEREVVLLGVRDHFELWDAHRWQRYLEKHLPVQQ